ncbi:MAG: hypothetical protein J0M05_12120, partial [Candidatus Kapabacteria bacterium]|nr:hypothetical protein [Candidatus Kapabacteria bacterium]
MTLSLSEYISQIHDNPENDFDELVELTSKQQKKTLSLPKNIPHNTGGRPLKPHFVLEVSPNEGQDEDDEAIPSP